METQDQPTKLSNLQLELLKIFSYNHPDEELLEIKYILTAYFAEKAAKEIDRLWDEKKWSHETMKQWLAEHMRIPDKK